MTKDNGVRAGHSGKLRPIAGYDGLYSVSEDGRVYSHRSGIWMRQHLIKGYPSVGLKVRGTRKNFRVHQLVASSFIGPKPSASMHCAHLDGDPLNNKVANLAWVTASENEAHKRLHNGGRHPLHSLSAGQSEIVRIAVSRPLTRQEVAVLAGVSEDTIYSVLKGRGYND